MCRTLQVVIKNCTLPVNVPMDYEELGVSRSYSREEDGAWVKNSLPQVYILRGLIDRVSMHWNLSNTECNSITMLMNVQMEVSYKASRALQQRRGLK